MKRIFLDHQSSMPVDQRVFEFAVRYLKEDFGNPSSLHSAGLEAKKAIDEARRKIADFINAPGEKSVIFTGGATEANNLAIKGTAYRNVARGRRVASSSIEHMSVLNPLKELKKNGFEYDLVPVDSYGIVDLKKLEEVVTEETVVTSVLYANNEIGTIEPIREISGIVHGRGGYLHVDATAAAGRIPLDVQAEGIDLLTLSSNDLYGPRGAGALYVKPGLKLQPLLPGGGQERGLRSGTENIFAIAGMGEAARLAGLEMERESARLKKIRDALIKGILEVEETFLTGHPEKRLPHHASFRFTGIEGEGILLLLDRQGIQVSTGSACSSQTLEASHVLLAIGLKHEEVHGSMVLTLGRSTKAEDAPVVIGAVKETVTKLRELSPLWKKH
ncbi:MAG: cysteine desulfurase [Candidatus Krumholzibacteriota bacterium]|nr:cysteine desulfurase [Candidatus Krumholzibacteriota bacterium]